MKNQLFIFVLITVCLFGCFSTDSGNNQDARTANRVGDSAQDFSNIVDKDWRLIEVYINDVNIQFSRDNQLESNRDIYTINFKDGTVSGTGAPNRYSAPYTLGDNQSISIMMMRSTLMASLFEPNNLTEYEYYSHVQKSYRWELNNENLVLHSKTENGLDVRLMFAK